jgi:murein DD-endopeptidase MepM/ murein hydrolase activator NlpD
MRRPAADARGWTRKPRRTGRAFFLVLLLTSTLGGLFVATPPSPTRADDLADAIAKQQAIESQIAKQKAQVAALAKSQAVLSGKLKQTKASLAQINADLIAVKTQVVRMTVDVAMAQAEVDELDAQVVVLDRQLVEIEAREAAKLAQLNERKGILAERIRLAYDTDRTTLLETMLSSDTFTDVLSEVSYHLDLAEQDKALAEQIVADQKVLTVIHATVVSTREQTESLRSAADAQRTVLDAQLVELAAARDRLAQLEAETARLLRAQQAAYAQMAKDKAALQKAIADGEVAEAALQKEINRLVAEQYRGGNIPSEYNGSLDWPMAGSVTQEYGCTGFGWEPPKGSCAHFHSGIDIAGPMYTPIRAAAPGVVLFAGPNPYDPYPKAWIVIVAHSQNLVTWYGHVDNIEHPPQVAAGDNVVAGQVIAYNGVTGRTTGPHLHWMVEFNNDFVNPRFFL